MRFAISGAVWRCLCTPIYGQDLFIGYLRLRVADAGPWRGLAGQLGLTEKDCEFIAQIVERDRDATITSEQQVTLADYG